MPAWQLVQVPQHGVSGQALHAGERAGILWSIRGFLISDAPRSDFTATLFSVSSRVRGDGATDHEALTPFR